MPENHEKPDEPIHLSAEGARGGELILRTRARKLIFLAGLIGSLSSRC